MRTFFAIVLFMVTLINFSENTSIGYYWRDYYSSIPPDAFTGGKDAGGKPTYIGQTYIHSYGVFVMQIISGKTTQVAAYGIKPPHTSIQKILCSKNPEHFYWMETSAKTFHIDTLAKHAVIGGFDHVDANKGMLHVGRITYEAGIKFGSIAGYLLENAQLSFVGGIAEKKANNFEVLMLDESKLESGNKNLSNCIY